MSATVERFSVKTVSSNAVRVYWTQTDIEFMYHYNLYYYPAFRMNDSRNCQGHSEIQLNFPARSSSWLIEGLKPKKSYMFALKVVVKIRGIIYEGERKELQYTLPGPGLQAVNYTYIFIPTKIIL